MAVQDLVKIVVYSAVPGAVATYRTIRDRRLGGHLVAATYVEVAALAAPAYLVEIEGEAVCEDADLAFIDLPREGEVLMPAAAQPARIALNSNPVSGRATMAQQCYPHCGRHGLRGLREIRRGRFRLWTRPHRSRLTFPAKRVEDPRRMREQAVYEAPTKAGYNILPWPRLRFFPLAPRDFGGCFRTGGRILASFPGA